MLNLLKTRLRYFLFSFLLALAIPIISVEASDWKTYENITHKISKQFCKKQAESKFNNLYKRYKGLGFYLPVTNHNKPAIKIIKKYFYLFDKKINWINAQKNNLSKRKNFLKDLYLIKQFSKRLNNLISTQYSDSKSFLYNWVIFKNDLRYFIYKRTSFLLPFGYPVNYEKLRQEYESLKLLKGKNNLQVKEQYFVRKIFEDGSQRKNHSRNDRFQRAILNTLLYKMTYSSRLSDTLIFDLEDYLSYSYRVLLKGKKYSLSRLSEWENRIKKQKLFYSKVLIDNSIKEYIQKQQSYTLKLKEFVLKKEGLLFQFWSRYKIKWRKLYVLETILTHEVGGLANLLEDKLDIGQVVRNRTLSKKYNLINQHDSLYPFLKESKIVNFKKYSYLNTLFKEGEFSFTYFFIPSVVRLFCPDQSRRGKRFRKKNFFIAQKIIARKSKFKGMRYFSRISILGRYKMDNIWQGYKRIATQKGKKLKKSLQVKYRHLLKIKKFQMLFYVKSYFKQPLLLYRSLDRKKMVLYNKENNIFYHYRNPDYFSFFAQF